MSAIKRKYTTVILSIALFGLSGFASAQTYTIKSFDNIDTKINLYYKPFSGVLTVSCLKDTLFINDFMSVYDVKFIDNRMMQIIYVKRAGSNENLMNLLLLCVDKSKLYQAIHIKSFSTYDMRNIYHVKGNLSEYQLFKVRALLLGNSKNTYKLNLNVHDESSSERTPKTNHNYNKQLTLNFDPKQNVFYNSRENISKSFKVYDPKTRSEIKEDVNGRVPKITIGDTSYYYIKYEWYVTGTNNYLLKYTYK